MRTIREYISASARVCMHAVLNPVHPGRSNGRIWPSSLFSGITLENRRHRCRSTRSALDLAGSSLPSMKLLAASSRLATGRRRRHTMYPIPKPSLMSISSSLMHFVTFFCSVFLSSRTSLRFRVIDRENLVAARRAVTEAAATTVVLGLGLVDLVDGDGDRVKLKKEEGQVSFSRSLRPSYVWKRLGCNLRQGA